MSTDNFPESITIGPGLDTKTDGKVTQPNPDGLIDVTPLRPRCRACERPLTPAGKFFVCLNEWEEATVEFHGSAGQATKPGVIHTCSRYQVLVISGLPPLTVVSEKP